MSNIKVIYSKKVHKMPISVQSYSALIETITKIYPILKTPFIWAVVDLGITLLYKRKSNQSLTNWEWRFILQVEIILFSTKLAHNEVASHLRWELLRLFKRQYGPFESKYSHLR